MALYRHALERHLLPGAGTLRLNELTPARLDHFLHIKRSEKGYATAKRCRAILSGVCGVAVRRDGLRVNPVGDVSSLETHGEREARALTVAECHERAVDQAAASALDTLFSGLDDPQPGLLAVS